MRKNCLEAIHAYANNKDDNSFVIAIPVAVWMRGPFMKSNRNKGGEGRRRGGGGGRTMQIELAHQALAIRVEDEEEIEDTHLLDTVPGERRAIL